MKKLFIALLLFTTGLVAQPTTIVVGHLAYKGHDFLQNESFQLTFQNVSISCNIDTFSVADVKRLLLNCGIAENKIVYMAAYSESTSDRIEVFFAYEGSIANQEQKSDISVTNKHHKKASGYGSQGGLIVPTFDYIISDSLRNIVKLIAYKYPIRSFYVAWTLNELPFLVIASGVTNGTLADMRHIKNSYRLVPYFKEANFQIIHYRDEQNVWKVLRRPANGW